MFSSFSHPDTNPALLRLASEIRFNKNTKSQFYFLTIYLFTCYCVNTFYPTVTYWESRKSHNLHLVLFIVFKSTVENNYVANVHILISCIIVLTPIISFVNKVPVSVFFSTDLSPYFRKKSIQLLVV